MTTKKIVIIVAAVVVVLGLVVLIFVGGIVGMVFYGIGNSEAANVSKEFLKNNERLKQDIGEVKDFGKFITGNINLNNGDGVAQLNIKVIGERKEVNAAVELVFRSGQQWHVTAASYRNEAGDTVDLLNPYESRKFVQAGSVLVELISVAPPCSLCLRSEQSVIKLHHRHTENMEGALREKLKAPTHKLAA
jgi:hypothetical protein